MQKARTSRDTGQRMEREGTEGSQHEGTFRTLGIMVSKKGPSTLYAIGWQDFEAIISKWPDNILGQLLETHAGMQSQKQEEMKHYPSSVAKKSWKSQSESLKISELFDQGLKRLYADLDESSTFQRFDDILGTEKPQTTLKSKRITPIFANS